MAMFAALVPRSEHRARRGARVGLSPDWGHRGVGGQGWGATRKDTMVYPGDACFNKTRKTTQIPNI